MAAASPVIVPCPACGEELEVPFSLGTGDLHPSGRTIEVPISISHDVIEQRIERCPGTGAGGE